MDKESKMFELSFDALAERPLPGTRLMINPVFSNDNKFLYYLMADSGSELLLYRLDISGRKSKVIYGSTENPKRFTLEEELRRERLRFAWDGLSGFDLGETESRTLVLLNSGGLYAILDVASGEIICDFAQRSIIVAEFSPLGNFVFASTGSELLRFDVATSEWEILARAANPDLALGLAEYIAQEEFGRQDGFWISPNELTVAFCEVDESLVPIFPITHAGIPDNFVEQHRYPLAGNDNAKVRIGILQIHSKEVYFLEDLPNTEEYIATVQWHDGSRLIINTCDRVQSRLSWWVHDISTHETRRFHCEYGKPWVNVPSKIISVTDSSILTTSEENGFPQIVALAFDGGFRQVTSGKFVINEILGFDSSSSTVFCTGSPTTPLEKHLLAVALHTGEVRCCTVTAGTHNVTLSKEYDLYLDQFSNRETPNTAGLFSLDGLEVAQLVEPSVNAELLGLHPPEIFCFESPSGVDIFGAIYLPPVEKRVGAPLVLSIYGGPHAQTVVEAWVMTIDLQAQYLAQNGVAVVKIDGRGSYGRGKEFESCIYKRFGQIELEDQLAGIEFAVTTWGLNKEKLGIYGWSYGGFMVLNALLRTKGVFSVGVAGAPVVDFRFYDTAYTERYMLAPNENESGYEAANLANFVSELDAPLLIIHGLIDENVHFRNTAVFLEAAIANGKDVDLLLLPETRHMPRGFATLRAIAKRRTEFLCKHLGVQSYSTR